MSLDQRTVAKRYAKALFESASENDCVNDTQVELQEVKKLFQEIPDLGKDLDNNVLSYDHKKKIVEELKNKSTQLIGNLFQIIFDNHRFSILSNIVDEFNNLVDDQNGVVRADVITATDIDSETKAKLSEKFAHKIGADKVVLDGKIDENIIGGVILKSHGLIYDGSIATQLNNLKQHLVN